MLQVMERTLRVDYHIPSKFKPSQAALTLIASMLVGDPTKRITVRELYEDPWFKKDFPDSVSVLSLQPKNT